MINLPFLRVNRDISLAVIPYFLFLKLTILADSLEFINLAIPQTHFPFDSPLKPHGMILTLGLFFNRLTFPVEDRVTIKIKLFSITNQTGVKIGFPFFL